jgi:hypothetical protein
MSASIEFFLTKEKRMLHIKLPTNTLLVGETYEDIFFKLQEGFFTTEEEEKDLKIFVKSYLEMIQRMLGYQNLVIAEESFTYELAAEKLIRIGIFEKVPE